MKDRTTEYARLVVSGKRLTGEAERQACQRHLDDLKRKNFPYIFDVKLAEKHINIANQLTIAEGVEPKPLVTRGFQNFILGSLFGWRKKRSTERRFREAYVQMGRQNGKSFLAGEMANDFATFSGYKEGRIYCTATKQDQANVVWDEVKKFIEADPDLEELYRIQEHDHIITSYVTKTKIKSVGRDTKSADGFRSILAIVDEYHAHPTNQMYKLMNDGQVKVDSALTIAITTAGFNLNGPCFEQYQFCKKVLSGAIAKETLFIYIAEMDPDDDVWDWHNWAKANPLNLWKNDTELDMDMVKRYAEKAIDAQEKKGKDLLNFETKTLNRWVEYGDDQYIDGVQWRAGATDWTLEKVRGLQCYIGIDLSQGGDLTSIGLIFPDLEENSIYVYSHSFMPELRLIDHEKSDDAPYRIWVQEGLLTLTSGQFGMKTDYKYIISHLKEIITKYDLHPVGLGYDPHNASTFLADLDFLGIDLTEIGQSAKALNDVTVDFQQSVEAGQVKYDKNNGLLNWSAVNARTVSNSFGEVKVEKQKPGQRIDPIYAILDAWKVMWLRRSKNKADANNDIDEWELMMAARKEKK